MKTITLVSKRGQIFNKKWEPGSAFGGNDEDAKTVDVKTAAQRIYDSLGLTYDFNEFLMGMNEELEHKDVTGGDLALTAKIAIAHLKEDPEYYSKLKVAMGKLEKGGPGSGRYPEGSGKENSGGGTEAAKESKYDTLDRSEQELVSKEEYDKLPETSHSKWNNADEVEVTDVGSGTYKGYVMGYDKEEGFPKSKTSDGQIVYNKVKIDMRIRGGQQDKSYSTDYLDRYARIVSRKSDDETNKMLKGGPGSGRHAESGVAKDKPTLRDRIKWYRENKRIQREDQEKQSKLREDKGLNPDGIGRFGGSFISSKKMVKGGPGSGRHAVGSTVTVNSGDELHGEFGTVVRDQKDNTYDVKLSNGKTHMFVGNDLVQGKVSLDGMKVKRINASSENKGLEKGGPGSGRRPEGGTGVSTLSAKTPFTQRIRTARLAGYKREFTQHEQDYSKGKTNFAQMAERIKGLNEKYGIK